MLVLSAVIQRLDSVTFMKVPVGELQTLSCLELTRFCFVALSAHQKLSVLLIFLPLLPWFVDPSLSHCGYTGRELMSLSHVTKLLPKAVVLNLWVETPLRLPDLFRWSPKTI